MIVKKCDLCQEHKQITHIIKLDPIEPEHGNKLLICKNCSGAIEDIEGGMMGLRLTRYEQLASLLWTVTGLSLEEIEETSCPESCCPNCEDDDKCPDAK